MKRHKAVWIAWAIWVGIMIPVIAYIVALPAPPEPVRYEVPVEVPWFSYPKKVLI